MKHTPTNPVLLAVLLGKMIDGDDKHQQDGPLPTEVRASLTATKAKLDSLNKEVQLSKGQYRQSSQDRREYVTKALVLTESYRDAVYWKVGHTDEVLVDYGLAARRKARRGTAGGTSPTAASKAERMKVHLARMEAQLENAKAHQSALETRIAEQKAKVAKAAEAVLPAPHTPQGEGGPEPSPPTPTSESNPK